MNKTSSLIVKLFIIASVAALVLAATNQLTAPIISERQEKEFKESFTQAYPDGKDFKSIETNVNPFIEEVIEVSDGSQQVGYVFKGIGKGGYGGDISYIIGVDNAGVVQGFKALKHSETQGYGSKMEGQEFVDGVVEVDISKGVTYGSGNKENGEIQQMSGATRSTKALAGSFHEVAKKMGELSDEIQPLGDIVIPHFASKYEELYAEADAFREVKNEIKVDKFVRMIDAFKGEDLLGHIIQLRASGFGGDIDFFLAVNKDKKVEKFYIVNHNESPEFGDAIETELYRNNIEGKSIASKIKLKKEPKREKDILLISGATVTSMAMQDAMNAAVNSLKAYDSASVEYEDLDLRALIAEEEKASKPAIDYASKFEGVGAVEPVGQDLLNENVTAINKTDAGDYIIDLTSKEGFAGNISAGILVAEDGTIKQFVYYEMNETEDYGGEAGEKAYVEKLLKQNLKDVTEFKATAKGEGKGEIQEISGATFTTSAITEIMNKAAEAFKGLK
ncbi:MAG: FMN-binding protein [Tissierellia bacterium]|nr:FMN-binding protein [Tissierellia bacterium]